MATDDLTSLCGEYRGHENRGKSKGNDCYGCKFPLTLRQELLITLCCTRWSFLGIWNCECVGECVCLCTYTLTHAPSYTHLFLSLSLTAGDTPWQIKVTVHFCAGPTNRQDEGVTQFALWPWPSVPMAHFAFYIHTQRQWHILPSIYIHNDSVTHFAFWLHTQW